MSEYPHLWERGLIQSRVRDRANHRCEGCDIEFHKGTNIAIAATRRDGNPIIGTVHHIDNDPANCTKRNLVYLCQRCHMFVQHRWRPGEPLPMAWRNRAPQWITTRKLPYQLNRQPVLFDVKEQAS